ncbi:MAG: F0F1 ATP synthase subunit B [Rhodospirillaceae bacterium]
MDWNDPTLWVAVGFFILVGGVFRPAKRAVTGYLDGRADKIRNTLDEAANLREEAQHLLAEYQRKKRDAMKETEELLARAREDAQRFADEGAAKLEESIKRREQIAMDKIAQAEADALREVRAMSVELAMAATRTLIADRLDAGKSAVLVDEAISKLSQRLH